MTTPEPFDLDHQEQLLAKASDCLSRVCAEQRFKLTACVPARPGVDDDLVLRDGLEAGVAMAAEIRRLRAEARARAIEELERLIREEATWISDTEVVRVRWIRERIAALRAEQPQAEKPGETQP